VSKVRFSGSYPQATLSRLSASPGLGPPNPANGRSAVAWPGCLASANLAKVPRAQRRRGSGKVSLATAPGPSGTALQGHAAVMPGRDLTTQESGGCRRHRVGRVEGTNRFCGVADAGTVIDDLELTLAVVQVAAQLNGGSPGWICSTAFFDQVDQRLLEVDRVAEHGPCGKGVISSAGLVKKRCSLRPGLPLRTAPCAAPAAGQATRRTEMKLFPAIPGPVGYAPRPSRTSAA